jgi:hypothetical protein
MVKMQLTGLTDSFKLFQNDKILPKDRHISCHIADIVVIQWISPAASTNRERQGCGG